MRTPDHRHAPARPLPMKEQPLLPRLLLRLAEIAQSGAEALRRVAGRRLVTRRAARGRGRGAR